MTTAGPDAGAVPEELLFTPLCERLGIRVPIIQAGMGTSTSARLAAAVSNAGGLGSIGCDRRPVDDVIRQLALVHELTNRPFAVNHLLTRFSAEAWVATLKAKPAVISFAGSHPGDLVKQAHEVGALVMHQVQTVAQARISAENGVDVIVAQGGEAGGHSGTVAALALVPQVVDAVTPVPVVAAGGIADGRGLAAAIALGAQAVNIGTRFLASVEAPVDEGWKQMIVAAASEDAVKFDAWSDISPSPDHYNPDAVVRAIRTPFIDHWQHHRRAAKKHASRLLGEVVTLIEQNRQHELIPMAGQSAGLVHEILPVDEILRRMVNEAVRAITQSAMAIAQRPPKAAVRPVP